MMDLKIEHAVGIHLSAQSESQWDVPVVRLEQVDTLIGEAVTRAESFVATIGMWGEWKDGCFYYNGTSAPELEQHLEIVQAFLASPLVAEWRKRGKGKS